MFAPLASSLRQLDFVVLQQRSGDKFTLLSDAPTWFVKLFPRLSLAGETASIAEVSPFLDNFILDANEFWNAAKLGACESGTWIEDIGSGKRIPLAAKAVLSEGKKILALHSPDPQYSEQLRTLQAARNSLLEHERLLSEIQKKEILLHCIVHDLSQPLSAMRGSFDCLAKENDAERIAKFIDLGMNASEQQENMIGEILKAFSTDLQTTLNAEKTVNDSPDLLLAAQTAALTLSPAFEAKSVRLTFHGDRGAKRNWYVHGEETRLRRVFTNLLENALRYTPEGASVTIGIEDDGSFFKAYIDDEGPGLPAELRPAEIFGLLTKGKATGGKAGLGLYFCRITVERWGGSIGCASLPERGARFWFRLPRAVVAENSVVPEKLETSMDETKQDNTETPRALDILLADDQEDIRTLTTHQLQRNGHTVVTVADGKAALEEAHRKHFDVILLDEEMPVVNGVQAAQGILNLQKKQQSRSVLIALTGNNTPDDRERLIQAGFDSVLGKPFRMESLEAFLRNPGKIGTVGVLPEKGAIEESASVEDLLQRVGGDEKLLRQMIRTFLRETPKRMETLKQALERSDGPELSARAHALKGSVSIFGATRAAQYSHSLQELGRIPDFREGHRVFTGLQEEIAKLQENLRGYAERVSAGDSQAVRQEKRKPKKPKSRRH